MNIPRGLAIDSSGRVTRFNNIYIILLSFVSLDNVYIADTLNHRIRKVTVSTGIITTIAGTGTASYSGDGGDATSATLYSPRGIALDSAGTTFIIIKLHKITINFIL